ncbi:MAG: hypothetical protein R3C12_10270 [Planctomycetaceae bacterium]|nr:hypothetical protein [Planctomycetaceae bacterium]
MPQAEQSRMLWFACGLMGGLLVSYFWPHEIALADVDRDSEAKFAMVISSTGPTGGDAVFVLDFLTGRLFGASLNPQLAKFNQFYARNVLPDFALTPDIKPRFVLSSGRLNISTSGGARKQPAQDGIYIAELNSGRVIVYAFPFAITTRAESTETLTIVDGFQFRQPSE